MKPIENFTVLIIIVLGLYTYEINASFVWQTKHTVDSDNTRYTVENSQSNRSQSPLYPLFLQKSATKQYVSTLHDVRMKTGTEGVCNVVLEIVKGSKANREINTGYPLNPITGVKDRRTRVDQQQQQSDSTFRWNYGAIPQTRQSPKDVDPQTGFGGCDKPIRVVDVGDTARGPEQRVIRMKILGAYPMTVSRDGAETTDWKMIGISADDPKFGAVHGLQDVETHFPGRLGEIKRWLTGTVNGFSDDGKDGAAAWQIIEKCHKRWMYDVSESRSNVDGWYFDNTTLNTPQTTRDQRYAKSVVNELKINEKTTQQIGQTHPRHSMFVISPRDKSKKTPQPPRSRFSLR